MTSSALPEPLEAFPIPEGAILLPSWEEATSERELAINALRQAMAERHLALPLGPELSLLEPDQLLSLNRVSVQLLCQGYGADRIDLPLAPWQQGQQGPGSRRPELALAALVDGENGVVWFAGVLTTDELLSQTPDLQSTTSQTTALPVEAFRGGIDRLFLVVQLLDPALPPLAAPAQAPADPGPLAVIDWLAGLLPQALLDLGAELQPLTAGAFRRSTAWEATTASGQPLAILSIPLGLGERGELLSGEASASCIERFRLLLIPTAPSATTATPATAAGPPPERLLLQLVGELEGDLLPDGLELIAVQGSRRQSIASSGSTALSLELPPDPALIEVSLIPPGGAALQLPPLQLPG